MTEADSTTLPRQFYRVAALKAPPMDPTGAARQQRYRRRRQQSVKPP